MTETPILPDSLYCDGGLIGPRNPSPLGCTWAYCLVIGGRWRVKCQAGVIEPADLGKEIITNNDAELIASLLALESVADGWIGILKTDSNVTRCRLEAPIQVKELSEEWRRRIVAVKKRINFKVVLIGGHPTRKELAKGFRSRNGLPVSEHNVWCDNACKRAGRKFLERKHGEGV